MSRVTGRFQGTGQTQHPDLRESSRFVNAPVTRWIAGWPTVGDMKKMMMAAAAIGLTGLLAGCGSGSAPDGSARGEITKVRTEYRLNTTSGKFIACDNIANNPGRANLTQVAVDFDLAGSIQDITIGLKGGNSTKYDNNFTTTVKGSELPGTGGKYRITFNADSSAAGTLLPQGIVVRPAPVTVKVVTTNANSRAGFFYPAFRVNTGSDTFTFSGILSYTTDVYTNCTVIQTTQEEI